MSAAAELLSPKTEHLDKPQLGLGGVAPSAVLPTPAFSLQLEFFTGPMDLLLHLVNQHEVPISEVRMADVAEQYLQIISHSRLLDLDRAMEYLVIASTLMALKSQSLLPADRLGMEGEGDQYDSDFYEELRERLKAYELTKQRARNLNVRPQLGLEVFARSVRMAPQSTEDTLEIENGDPQLLGGLLTRLMKRIGAGVQALRIRLEPISVVNFMMRIVDTLQDHLRLERPRTFSDLVTIFSKRAQGKTATAGVRDEDLGRGVVIGTFLATLELVRRGYLGATQSGDNEEIEIELKLHEATSQEQQNKVVQLSDYIDPEGENSPPAAHGNDSQRLEHLDIEFERKEANRG